MYSMACTTGYQFGMSEILPQDYDLGDTSNKDHF